jgi:maltose/moltooligosaccharide transporter
VCSIATVLVSIISTPELPPTEEELAALRAKKGGLGAALREIGEAIVEMPRKLQKLALVYLFQWYAMVCYWQYVSLSIAETVWGATAEDPAYDQAVGWGTVATEVVRRAPCEVLVARPRPEPIAEDAP